jgi:hypothetical protein
MLSQRIFLANYRAEYKKINDWHTHMGSRERARDVSTEDERWNGPSKTGRQRDRKAAKKIG